MSALQGFTSESACLWSTPNEQARVLCAWAQAPEPAVASSLQKDLRQKDRHSAFTRPQEGKYGLRAWQQQ